MLNKILLIISILWCCNSLHAQNIFDESNSRAYANYLFKAGEFQLAAEEFERLNFMHAGNDTFQTRMIQSYRKLSNFDLADKRFSDFYPDQNFKMKGTINEYLIVQLRLNRNNQTKSFIDSTVLLNSEEKLFFKLSADLLGSNYESGTKQITEWNKDLPDGVTEYHNILTDYYKTRFKKQFIAGSLSAIVPGLGQTYSGYWKDGIFALLFTVSSAYQSYRGFDKTGIKSPYGWIYGVLGTGFYIGNIYGAVKGANKYNFIKKKEIDDRIENVFTTYYP